ncbi:DUF559 domain-containing protein [Methylobacterium sp. PvR107]|uniref:DUF559 domain-containing protein n=1 Tax=Methylobacterium sp. PvR107 TaxID=2806597 RepID=UPI001AE56906|nr:DUF559 domain-containing protein [Methylobacterium sp. PvR107]MBP1179037.1 very-short-patch-repair endonuclease [Methylobacterium sp. PvR107]
MGGAAAEQTRFRRDVREAQTEAKCRLRYRSRERRLAGSKFVRQESIGRSVADFCGREGRRIVELDGGQQADSGHDRGRDAWPIAQGYRVLPFWNAEVVNDISGDLDIVLAALPPSPRLRGKGRDDPFVGAASLKGEGEGAAPVESQPEPPPHPRLPPRSDDDTVAGALSPRAGRGEKH